MKICGTPPKLSLADAVLLRSLFKAGHSKTELARRFGVANRTVTDYLSARHKAHDFRMLDPIPQQGMVAGESNGNSKLTTPKVLEIRHAAAQGVSFASLGRTYGLHPTSIKRITTGVLWAHVE